MTPRRKLPTWLKVTLGAFAALFTLAAIFGASPDNPATPAAATTPAVPTYTVTNVIDGERVYLRDSTGVPKTVRAAGIDAPTTTYCWGPETANWATTFLAGKQVTIRALDQGMETMAALTLPDGTDYSTEALKRGYAKYAPGVTDGTYATALQTAENTARAANTGLWGAPCLGTIDAPTPSPATTLPATTTVTPPKPPTSPTTPPAPTTPASTQDSAPVAVYFKNCAEAKAAGAAPLHRGDPGYRPQLDRDHDGTACE
ncbi:hypothetical protein HFP15_11230 [Amycolatopsis sp. K13G38]|uniref:TNase-like domain-containing protein n=1 Tax=Amycolatopsis acididurans TaxID=2724524 RepID=A0ABX1J593_9PSEU|nr:hypothetical protein [Amycolatopsis acididurans]